MKYIYLFLSVLFFTHLTAQSNFSKIIDLDTDHQRGMQIVAADGLIHVLAEKDCAGFAERCGILFQMDENGDFLIGHEMGDFELGEGDNLSFIEDELLAVSGHSNSPDLDTAMYVNIFDLNDLTGLVTKFNLGSAGGELENAGFLFTEDPESAFFYGTNRQANRDNGILIETPEPNVILSVMSWDEGNKDYNIIKMEVLTDSSFIYAVDFTPQGTSLTGRSIKTITKFGDIETIWESDLILDLGTETDFIRKDDGSFVIIVPNEENTEAAVSPFIKSISADGDENWNFKFSTDDASIVTRDVFDIEEASNGDIIGIGAIEHEELGKDIAWIFRINPQGELMWERSYSEYDWFNEQYRESRLNKIVELDDGSLVGTGFMKENSFSVSDEQLWVLKVAADGCFSGTDCGFEQNVSAVENITEIDVDVFPNPVNSVLYIQSNEKIEYQLLDLSGISLRKGSDKKLDISDLNTGFYLLRLRTKDGRERIEKVVKL